ncbi:DUF2259 domain-containing protein [Deinococcus sp. Marseille-Q6407]|uniref:DUF2259 domain-containing protein n=1 Tax=Deinococcus sp. Marseille-Q6407 TaxID=2969223 RepID=UPI0021BF64FF|nr:DUF2259 domain-containing protein [Deinococcus sp. Marseille-Q6407]
MKRALLLTLPALLATQAAAANLPQPYLYGFSPDGAYHLMLTYWTEDGSGFPAAQLRVVRQGVGVMLEERLVAREEAGAGTRTSEQLAQDLLTKHAARLRALGLERPVPGRVLWAQGAPLPSLSGWPAQDPQTVTLAKGAPGGVQNIEVSPQAAFNTCTAAGLLPAAPVGLRLRVNGQDWFRDGTRLPENRACVAAYRLEAAWQLGDAVAVLIRAYSPGFEGPDAQTLTLLSRLPATATPAPASVPAPASTPSGPAPAGSTSVSPATSPVPAPAVRP